jgi:putative zinc finger protein
MHTEMNELMQHLLDNEASAVETQRLQTHLAECGECAREWNALISVHRLLRAAPMLSPADGFAERVLNRIAAHQRQAIQRPGAVTILVLATVASGVAALSIALSPVADMLQTDQWAASLGSLLSAITTLSAWLGVFYSFASVMAQWVGTGPVLVVALLTLALTIFWTRIVVGAPFNHPVLSNGDVR